MTVKQDIKRGLEVIHRLNSATAIDFFNIQYLPMDVIPEDIEKGSPLHLLYLTYVSCIDYLRIEERLWTAARETFNDEDTRYLFDPNEVMNQSIKKLEEDLELFALILTKKQIKDWKTGNVKFLDPRKTREKDINLWMSMSKMLTEFNGDIQAIFEKEPQASHQCAGQAVGPGDQPDYYRSRSWWSGLRCPRILERYS